MSFDRRELIHLLTFAAGSGIAGLDGPLAQAAEAVTPPESSTKMEKVLGVGGLFFRAKDPVSLGRWYKEHLRHCSHPCQLGGPSLEDRGWCHRLQPFPGDKPLLRRPQADVDGQLPGARSGQNGYATESGGNSCGCRSEGVSERALCSDP